MGTSHGSKLPSLLGPAPPPRGRAWSSSTLTGVPASQAPATPAHVPQVEGVARGGSSTGNSLYQACALRTESALQRGKGGHCPPHRCRWQVYPERGRAEPTSHSSGGSQAPDT